MAQFGALIVEQFTTLSVDILTSFQQTSEHFRHEGEKQDIQKNTEESNPQRDPCPRNNGATYNLIDGTVQKLCETCLNPDSSIVSQWEFGSRGD